MPRTVIPPCPECGGRRVSTIIQTSRPHAGYSDIFLLQPARTPDVFKGKNNQSELYAQTCLECGYTNLRAVQLENLRPDD